EDDWLALSDALATARRLSEGGAGTAVRQAGPWRAETASSLVCWEWVDCAEVGRSPGNPPPVDLAHWMLPMSSSNPSTDHNLLFAVLALQADLIDRDRFVQACTLWASRKDTPLATLLVELGWLSAEDCADVE